jgi:hypothetical protein
MTTQLTLVQEAKTLANTRANTRAIASAQPQTPAPIGAGRDGWAEVRAIVRDALSQGCEHSGQYNARFGPYLILVDSTIDAHAAHVKCVVCCNEQVVDSFVMHVNGQLS